VELRDACVGAGSTPVAAFLDDIKQLPADFPKAKRLYLALGDNLPRLREWFGAFYHKPEMAGFRLCIHIGLGAVAGEAAHLSSLRQ
jgi:hypothetical protein